MCVHHVCVVYVCICACVCDCMCVCACMAYKCALVCVLHMCTGYMHVLDIQALLPHLQGLVRLPFQPYTFQQLEGIVTSRLERLHVFDPDAIKLAARKVRQATSNRIVNLANSQTKYKCRAQNFIV